MSISHSGSTDSSSSVQALLDCALGSKEISARRQAFIQLAQSREWRQVLAPHVISKQGYSAGEGMVPDWLTFRRVSPIVAGDPEKVKHCLDLAGARFSGALLSALAGQMGPELVEPTLKKLGESSGPQAALLQRTLQEADPDWTKHPLAQPIIRQQLVEGDSGRWVLMNWLAEGNHLEPYLTELSTTPPRTMQEWSALGRAQIRHMALYHYALATLVRTPSPVHYLLRLNPLPEEAVLRILCAAQPDWLATLFESLLIEPFDSPWLIPLAEVAVHSSGRAMAIANAWIGASKLGRQLLARFSVCLTAAREQGQSPTSIWPNYRPPSAESALQAGRSGQVPGLMDAAALVRHCHGQNCSGLIRDILAVPYPGLVESVLRPLVGVNPRAAMMLQHLCLDEDEQVAERAKEARGWPDVCWPDRTDEPADNDDEDATERVELP